MKHLQIRVLYQVILLVFVLLFSAPSVYSQDVQEIKISGNFSNVPLQEFFTSLQKNYGVKVYYKEEWIKSKVITQSFNNLPLVQAMNQVFNNNELTFKFFQNNSVVIYPRGYG